MEIKPLKLIPKNKKGMGIGDIYPVVLAIAVVAILLAVVMFTLDEFGETMATDEGTAVNESGAWINGTGHEVDRTDACHANNFAAIEAYNNTDGALIPAGSYSLSSEGFLTNVSGAWLDVNISYTYEYGGVSCNATEDIIDDFVDFIPWIGVILLIVAAAIVLGILMKSFSGENKRI